MPRKFLQLCYIVCILCLMLNCMCQLMPYMNLDFSLSCWKMTFLPVVNWYAQCTV